MVWVKIITLLKSGDIHCHGYNNKGMAKLGNDRDYDLQKQKFHCFSLGNEK